jgi:hypothetical protein
MPGCANPQHLALADSFQLDFSSSHQQNPLQRGLFEEQRVQWENTKHEAVLQKERDEIWQS